MTDPALLMLAQKAGLLTQWVDAAGQRQQVSEPVLRDLLGALELPCATPAQIRDSLHELACADDLCAGDLVVLQEGQVPRLQCRTTGYWQLVLESGRISSGALRPDSENTVSLPPVLELGYHQLIMGNRVVTLAVVPKRCPVVPADPSGNTRPWGIVSQIYSLRESWRDNQGMIDGTEPQIPAWLRGSHFGTVAQLAADAAGEGAGAHALSPAHAMFSADPTRHSPYSPSSRLFLNVGYGDPVSVLGIAAVQHVLKNWNETLSQDTTRSRKLQDWPRIFPLRLQLLRDLFDHFEHHGSSELKYEFETFRRLQGEALARHATYEALHEYYASRLGRAHGWQDWPTALHDPANFAIGQFAQEHASDVAFHAFAQWVVHESARRAQRIAQSAGMQIGLVGDLAIGTDPRGSDAWGHQAKILRKVSVGAPPDIYYRDGQCWNLTALSPRGLRRDAYTMFIKTLRATFAYTGGIRIDHVAGLERLWLIPDGAHAADGAYLRYPRHELLGLVALEATRHQAIVIGENLGTISTELNNSLTERGILGTSVLWFERKATPEPVTADPFRAPQEWPRHSVAMTSTHDLPTVHGWWQERDIQWQLLLGHLKRANQALAQQQRASDRAELWRALLQADCVSATSAIPPTETPLEAILSFVARTPSPLALFSLEDLLGVLDQPNMPGFVADSELVHHPNWEQRLPLSVDQIVTDDAVAARFEAIREARRLT